MRGSTTIYSARGILTLDPARPRARAVAVRDGRVLAVGELNEVMAWGPAEIDDRFADAILIPGFVEGHAHAFEGNLWRHAFTGFFDRRDPEGRIWPGLRDIPAVVERLRAEAIAKPGAPVIAWGFDPIFLEGRRMRAADLDAVATDRPVLVLHANGHLLNVNTFTLKAAGIDAADEEAGILGDETGAPTGELLEMAAMFRAFRAVRVNMFSAGADTLGLWNFARVAQRAGVTTVTDLFSDLGETAVAAYREATADPDWPVRLVPAFNGLARSPEAGVAHVRALAETNTDTLRFGPVKLMTDGSIQGFTARLKWPHYFNGRGNGLWNATPDQLRAAMRAHHDAGSQIHVHVNGDEASDLAITLFEDLLAASPRPDHRHVLQHCQMADAAQFRRAAALGLHVNLFVNHVYYWGDVHRTVTLGPDRARRMNATATARALGVPFALHSDAPVTPLDPLFTLWCAVNRLTASGVELGPEQRIGVEDALHAVTLGAARTLKLDDEIGSIEVGKRADFAILDADPTAVPTSDIRAVRVLGTILGGRVFKSGP